MVLFLQAITALGFKEPTPIQKACVPVGLMGRDLCACAATGTGTRTIYCFIQPSRAAAEQFLVSNWKHTMSNINAESSTTLASSKPLMPHVRPKQNQIT